MAATTNTAASAPTVAQLQAMVAQLRAEAAQWKTETQFWQQKYLEQLAHSNGVIGHLCRPVIVAAQAEQLARQLSRNPQPAPADTESAEKVVTPDDAGNAATNGTAK